MPSRPNTAACEVLINTSVAQRATMTVRPNATAPTNDGFGPASLQAAYKLPSGTAGQGQTVAVVDAFNDPNAVSDLATYRADFGQPACNTSTQAGCLTVVNQNGQTSPLPRGAGTSGWATEESLDVDMVSAICPNCHILLVEVKSATIQNLGTGVNAAVTLGAVAVSNSYGGSESSSDAGFDSQFYEHSGVAVTASAGDSGFGVSYPAASQFVTSVGGTSLTTASNTRGWAESVWSTSSTEGTGAGCSADDAKPAWQTDTGCSRRTDNDVAAVADPNTGVAVFDTFDQNGFLEVGGTSASSPIIASVFALAGTPSAGTFPSSDIYQHTSSLFDVTTGSLGSCSPAYLCTAETGFDGPTGWGTPDGTAAFTG
jgi:subtilase family serine protease